MGPGTYHVRDPQGEVIEEWSNTPTLLSEYVYLDGQRVCKINLNSQGTETGRVYYHADILGTPVAETNELGQLLVRSEYYPFGDEVKPGAATDPRKFTGKELDAEFGLYYFGARYYDAHLGRFVSVDPVGGDSRHPQSWNRYAYGLNNPIRYRDPDGGFVGADDLAVAYGVYWLTGATAGAAIAWLGAPSPTYHGMTNAGALLESVRHLFAPARAVGQLAPSQPGSKPGKSQQYDQSRQRRATQYNNDRPPGGENPRPGGDIPPGAPGPDFKPRDLGPSLGEDDILRMTQPNFPLAGGLAVGSSLLTLEQWGDVPRQVPTFQEWQNEQTNPSTCYVGPSPN